MVATGVPWARSTRVTVSSFSFVTTAVLVARSIATPVGSRPTAIVAVSV